MGASVTYCMVHLQAIASHLPDTPMTVYGTGRWAHFNVKLHYFILPKAYIYLNFCEIPNQPLGKYLS